MRFVFSPACENPSESTTVRRTTGPLKRNRVSILALDPRLLVQNKLVTPLSSRRLAEISGLRKSVTSQVVFILLPALVLTRKRRCP